MTKRRIGWIALAFAVVVQAAWAIMYESVINGCCGGLLLARQPPISLPHVLRFAEFGAQPLSALVGGPQGLAPLITRNLSGVEWAGIVLFAAVNTVLWFGATYLLLHGIVLLCRIRLGAGVSGRRVRLAERAAVRPAWVAVGALLLLALILAAGAMHRRWWLSEAKRVLHASIDTARTGGDHPRTVELTLSGTPQALQPQNFTGDYIRTVEARMYGKHPLDAFAAPMLLAGEIRFSAGPHYEFRVQRLRGGWKVWIGAPCRGEGECLSTIDR
jgi:hypothetical protein